MGPNIAIERAMSAALGSQMLAGMFDMVRSYAVMLSNYWFLSLIVFTFGVEIALIVWAKVKGI